eukprot:897249-Lingulodinium_polyedra.AAC.1
MKAPCEAHGLPGDSHGRRSHLVGGGGGRAAPGAQVRGRSDRGPAGPHSCRLYPRLPALTAAHPCTSG